MNKDTLEKNPINATSRDGDELHCVDKQSASSLLISVDRVDLLESQFQQLERNAITRAVNKNERFEHNGFETLIASPLKKEFIDLLNPKCELKSVEVLSFTVQRSIGVFRYHGENTQKGGKQLAKLVCKHLPKSLQVEAHKRDKRERGRKVGLAAKDKAALRIKSLNSRELKKLEEAGGQIAYEAVSKSVVTSKPTLEDLREKEVPPAIAFLVVKLWRMLSVRPFDGEEFRKIYMRKVPKIFEALENATRVTDAVIDLQSVLRKEPEAKNVFGRALSSFGKFGSSKSCSPGIGP